jgi:hypothetical protein
MNALVDTIALGLTCSEEPEGEPDLAHYDALSEIKLGHHFMIEASKFFDMCNTISQEFRLWRMRRACTMLATSPPKQKRTPRGCPFFIELN